MFKQILISSVLISGTIFGSLDAYATNAATPNSQTQSQEWQEIITPQVVSFSILGVGLVVVGVAGWQQQRKSSEVKRLSNVQKAILVNESQRQPITSQPVTPELNWFLEEANESTNATSHQATNLDGALPTTLNHSWFLDEAENEQSLILPVTVVQNPVTIAPPVIMQVVKQSTTSPPSIQNAVSQFATVQSVLGLTHKTTTTKTDSAAEVATFTVKVPRPDQLAELKWVGNHRQG